MIPDADVDRRECDPCRARHDQGRQGQEAQREKHFELVVEFLDVLVPLPSRDRVGKERVLRHHDPAVEGLSHGGVVGEAGQPEPCACLVEDGFGVVDRFVLAAENAFAHLLESVDGLLHVVFLVLCIGFVRVCVRLPLHKVSGVF